MKRTRDDHLFGPGPKRILTLDGGGVRGIVTLGFLDEVERLLRERHGGDSDFRLCEHFDLIGGTSAGATIAAGLALGYSVSEIIDIYLELMDQAFEGWRWHGGIFAPKFRSENMFEVIRRQIGDTTLGSDEIRTGLAMIAKRIDTGSPWVFHNNPRSQYFAPPEDDPGAVANRDIEIAEILRASTAAPTYFEPEEITIAENVEGLFVDGGVSPFNNPALLLLMMATSESYGYGWDTGPENLSLVSVGTGLYTPSRSIAEFLRLPSSLQAINALESVITDGMWHAQAVLQWLGTTAKPWTIDREAGDFASDTPSPTPLFHYQRFDILLERDWLATNLGESLSAKDVEMLAALDRPESADHLLAIARKAAKKQVTQETLLWPPI